ncbi:MAG: hypothetical protein ACXWXL_03305 [Candidatus Binatia bacterium]
MSEIKAIESGSDLTVAIDLVDGQGSIISADSVSYALYDGDNVSLFTGTPSFVAGDLSVSITIEGSLNELALNASAPVSRLLMATALTASGEKFIYRIPYIVYPKQKLGFMSRSYQTYQNAELVAYELPNLEAWPAADERQKIGALIEAFDRIGRLTFIVDGLIISELNASTPEVVATLSADFRAKLRKAQVIEADIILGGDTVAEKRENGLMSETVGESSNMWRPGKPLSLAVSKRALNALTGYIRYGVGIGRA